MRLAERAVICVILAAAGCSGGASPSEVVSCSATLGSSGLDAGSPPPPPFVCAEYAISPDSVAAERKSCVSGGDNTFKPSSCSRHGVVEGCRFESPKKGLTTLWLYRPGYTASFCPQSLAANGGKVEFLKPDGGIETKPMPIPTVDAGPRVDPVQECLDHVVATVPDTCKQCLCTLDDICRNAVSVDRCDATCWGLIQCIDSDCPNFAAMASMMDFSCVTGKCAPFLSGSTGTMGAGPCVERCQTACAALLGAPDGGH